MKVELISYTPNPEELVAKSAKLCYSSVGVNEIADKLTDEEIERFVQHIVNINHESVLEHISFTFAVEGISRSLTHQLVRHRIASYSQQSQRYVRLDQFEYIVPPEIKKIPKMELLYLKHMKETQIVYDILVDNLIKEGRTEKQAIEDARYIFPNACETKIVFTMNARSLLNFLSLRHCRRAQWEIREMSVQILKLIKEVAPNVFKNAGANCISGKCTEGSKTCGQPYKRDNKEE